MNYSQPPSLGRLLDTAAGPADPSSYDVSRDLHRGHRALGRTRRRRGAAVLGTLVVVGVVGVGATVLRDAPGSTVVPDRPAAAAIVPLAEPLRSGSYTFDATPEGWDVQGGSPTSVTIAPTDGSVSERPDDFRGKLVVMYDQNPLGGDQVSYDGRTFWTGGDSGYVHLAVATRPDEPSGAVRLQYPADAGWTRQQMLELLDSVHLGAGARPGVG